MSCTYDVFFIRAETIDLHTVTISDVRFEPLEISMVVSTFPTLEQHKKQLTQKNSFEMIPFQLP